MERKPKNEKTGEENACGTAKTRNSSKNDRKSGRNLIKSIVTGLYDVFFFSSLFHFSLFGWCALN